MVPKRLHLLVLALSVLIPFPSLAASADSTSEADALAREIRQLQDRMHVALAAARRAPVDRQQRVEERLSLLRERLRDLESRAQGGLGNQAAGLRQELKRVEDAARAARPDTPPGPGGRTAARLAPPATSGTGSISGTVTDAGTSAPLSGVYVYLYDADQRFVTSATTDTSGNYTLSGLGTGSYFARTGTYSSTGGPGYLDEYYDDVQGTDPLAVTPISVTDGANTPNINFGLAAGGRVAGTVTNSSTSAPVAGVSVYLYDVYGKYWTSGTTDANGQYITRGVPAGTYYAYTYNSLGLLDEAYDNIPCASCDPTLGMVITVALGATTGGIDFALDPSGGGGTAGAISGTVTASSGTPLAYVYVDIYNSSGSYVTYGRTDTSGNYTASVPAAGTYYAKTYNYKGYIDELYDNIACAGGSCSATSGTAIAVTAGATTSGINFALDPGGSVAGALKDATTSAPLGGEVDIYDSSGQLVGYGYGYADSGGSYTTQTGLQTGTYYAKTYVDYESPGYANQLYSGIDCISGCTATSGTPIGVTQGATTSGIDFNLSKGGAITGTVTAGTVAGVAPGTPLAGVTVNIYDSSGYFVTSGRTGFLGQFVSRRALDTGTYYARTNDSRGLVNKLHSGILCVSCDATTGTAISVTRGSPTGSIDFALDQGGRIGGKVVSDQSGARLKGGFVYAYDSAGNYITGFGMPFRGNFLSPGLPAGTYYAYADGFRGYKSEIYNDVPCGPDGCYSNIQSKGTAIAVAAGTTSAGIDFSLASRGSAVIGNGTVQLGVNAEGDLNAPSGTGTAVVGLRYLPTSAEGLAQGCLCEGWGAADASTGATGSANEDKGGPSNLTVQSFTASSSAARSVVNVGSTLEVTHYYHPSASANLFQVDVAIRNISASPVDLRYRRVMDWDVPPTAFNEYVTVQTGGSSAISFTSDNGFASANPLAGPSSYSMTGSFTDSGPADHGALFDFSFGTLSAGGTRRFTLYFGAAGTEQAALDALTAVGAVAYSFGQPSTTDGPTLGTPNTFIFGFGEAVTPALSVTDVSLAEGASGTAKASFAVSLSAPSGQTVSVDYATADGTATAGSDYVASTGTLTFAPGETVKTVDVTVNGDTTIEADESFTLGLSNAVGASIARAQGTGTIRNDDSGIVKFTATPIAIQPGGSSTLSWTVTSGSTVTLNGTAVASPTGSLAVSPTASTTYTLTATSGSFTDTGTLTVVVLPPAGVPVSSPTTSNQVSKVKGVTFTWTSVTARGGTGAASSITGYGLTIVDALSGTKVFDGSLTGSDSVKTLVDLDDGDYIFGVRACTGGKFTDADCGAYATSTVTVDLVKPTEKPVVASLGSADLTSSTQTFSWSPVAKVDSGLDLFYEVLLQNEVTKETVLQITVPDTVTSTIASLGTSDLYSMVVRACQSACGDYSDPLFFTLHLPPVPTVAPAVSAPTVTGNRLDVSWGASGADLYQIQVIQPNSGPGGGALTVAAQQVSTTDVTLAVPPGQASIVVAACNGDGCGPFSTPVDINPTGPSPSTPNPGTPMAGTVVAGPTVLFTWNRIPGDDTTNTTYRVYVQDLSRQAAALDVLTTTNYYGAYFKAEGARYDVLVIANPTCDPVTGACSGGTPGPAVGFNVAGASADAPTMVSPAHNSTLKAGNIQLGWSPVAGATLYEYFVAVQGISAPTVRGVTPGLFVQVPLAAAGGANTIYSGIVRACPAGATCAAGSDAGWGPWSVNAGPGVTNFTVTP